MISNLYCVLSASVVHFGELITMDSFLLLAAQVSYLRAVEEVEVIVGGGWGVEGGWGGWGGLLNL